jgi:hypothetical protein
LYNKLQAGRWRVFAGRKPFNRFAQNSFAITEKKKMTTTHRNFTIALLLMCGFANAQEREPAVNDFAWLAGCWQHSGNGREMVEQWMKPAGDLMLGMSRTVANGKARAFEFLQIRQKEDGGIFYVAIPSGQKETWFKLVQHGTHEAVFENPEHDFPQRIIYRLENDGSLAARIEGTVQGQLKGVDFPYQRTKCD